MNRLGIMVDVSHGSDDVFYDAIKVSRPQSSQATLMHAR